MKNSVVVGARTPHCPHLIDRLEWFPSGHHRKPHSCNCVSVLVFYLQDFLMVGQVRVSIEQIHHMYIKHKRNTENKDVFNCSMYLYLQQLY